MKLIKRIFSKIKRLIKSLIVKQPYTAMPNARISTDSAIGDYTYIGYNCLITKATIGRYCSIADNVSIGPGEHDVKRASTSSLFYKSPYEELTKDEIIIGNDVWIGVNSVIRRGVKIGDGAVIGANSFVNKDVPAFEIYAGTPAKFIKNRFDQTTIEHIQRSQWWEKSCEEASPLIHKLNKDLLVDDES